MAGSSTAMLLGILFNSCWEKMPHSTCSIQKRNSNFK